LARRDAVLAAIAAERFRLRTGKQPSQLEALVPEFLADVPRDPFTRGFLKLIADEKSLAIYSVGVDGKDDRGSESSRLNEPDIVVRLKAQANSQLQPQ